MGKPTWSHRIHIISFGRNRCLLCWDLKRCRSQLYEKPRPFPFPQIVIDLPFTHTLTINQPSIFPIVLSSTLNKPLLSQCILKNQDAFIDLLITLRKTEGCASTDSTCDKWEKARSPHSEFFLRIHILLPTLVRMLMETSFKYTELGIHHEQFWKAW